MIFKRDLFSKIGKYLQSDEIILITGARQAGKTTLLHQLEEKIKSDNNICHFLNLENPEYLSFLNKSPDNLMEILSLDLNQKSFVLIDEIQYLDNPTSFLKYIYDEYKGKIKIIASGSSAFYLDKKFKDSLVGRKIIFTLLTLSFKEFLRFKNEEELSKRDFNNVSLSERKKILSYYQEYFLYGGYPKVVLSPLSEKERVLNDIAFSYIKKDVFDSGLKKEDVFYKLLRILASQVGNLVNTQELASVLGVSRTVVENYLYVMQKSFHVRLIRPFYGNIRKEITKMPKVYFLDLGLRNFLLKNFKTFNEREDKGSLLENILFRELLKNHDFDEIRFWRTNQGKEVDFVINEEQAFEVKANLIGFKKNKHKFFLENYPGIKFSLVSLNYPEKQVNGIPVIETWKI